MTALTNTVSVWEVTYVNESPPEVWNIVPNIWETLPKDLKLLEIFTFLLHVSRFPAKSSDIGKNVVFLTKQLFLELNNIVYANAFLVSMSSTENHNYFNIPRLD